MRLPILVRKASRLRVEFEGSARGASFYMVSRTEICKDCKGSGVAKYRDYKDSCVACEAVGEITKTDRVEVRTEDKKTVMYCTCQHSSLFAEAECATKIAIILYEHEKN